MQVNLRAKAVKAETSNVRCSDLKKSEMYVYLHKYSVYPLEKRRHSVE